MKKKIFQFTILFAAWLALSWSVSLPELTLGIVVCFLIVYITAALFDNGANTAFNPARSLWFAVYLGYIIWDSLKAAFEALLRMASPNNPAIEPRIIQIRTSLKDPNAIELLTNTIALLPGTLSSGEDLAQGLINVHCMAKKGGYHASAIELALRKYEKILRKVYE